MTDARTWRDYARSRAVLIGAWDYTQLPPVPAACRSLDRMVRTLTGKLCGWPAERVQTFRNVDRRGHLPDRLMELYDDVTDIALFYFVGHGQLHGDDLCLALTESPQNGPRRLTTGLPFADVRSALRECDADTKIVILDCCFSGIATLPQHTLAATTADKVDVIEKVSGTGAFTMTASGAYRTAWHEPNENARASETYFTKYLIDVIEQGAPGHPEGLPLRVIFDLTADALARDRRPEPTRSVRNDADRFVLTRNAAALRSVSAKRPPPGQLGQTTPPSKTTVATDGQPKLMPVAPHDAHRPVPARKPARGASVKVDSAAMQELWPQLLHKVAQHNRPTQALLFNAEIKMVEGNTLVLSMATSGLAALLGEERRVGVIEKALRELTGSEWHVQCVHADAPPVANSSAALAPTPQTNEPTPVAATAPSVSDSSATVDTTALQGLWPQLLHKVAQHNRPTQALMLNAEIKMVEGNTLVLSMATSGLAKQLGQQRRIGLIEEALRELTGNEWHVQSAHADAPPVANSSAALAPTPQTNEPTPVAATAPSVSDSSATVDTTALQGLWPQLLHKVAQHNRPTQALMLNAKVTVVEGNTLVLSMPTHGLTKQLGQQRRIGLIENALRELTGNEWHVQCV